MGLPSTQASNAILYLTYGAFLIFGLFVAWKYRHQSKTEFLSSNRTQSALPLALNFIASALGSGLFFTYPQVSVIAGVQGLVIYTLASSLPILAFAALGPTIRRKAPDGFVLTEWTRRRYGAPTAIWLSFLTIVTMYLYMVAELSAMYQVVNVLTGLDGLPAIIVEAAVTVMYTFAGGFRVSFITDSIQAVLALLVVIIGIITVAVEVRVDRDLIASSGFLGASRLGWQLLYILPVAVLTNDFFLSGFWMRTFASRTDKDLWIGTGLATIVIAAILAFVGCTGLLAAWSGLWPNDDDPDGYTVFFNLVVGMPSWVIGILLVMMVSLSTAIFDSLLSATISTLSNDFFRNRLNIWFIRAGVVLLIFPVVVVALKAPNILQIFLISDLVSSAIVPVLFIGLTDWAWWWRGFEVVVGSLGGIFTVFLFGLVYYEGDATAAGNLLLLEGGLYGDDWSAFGAFLAAPLGGLLWGLAAFLFRVAVAFIRAKVTKTAFKVLTKPVMDKVPKREVAHGGLDGRSLDSSGVGCGGSGEGIVKADKRPGDLLRGEQYHGLVEHSTVSKFF